MNKIQPTGKSTFPAILGTLCVFIGGLCILIFSIDDYIKVLYYGIGFIAGGIILLRWAFQLDKPNENETKRWHEANEIVTVRTWAEVNTILKIKNTFIEAGSSPNEAKELTRIAVRILKDWSSDDWTTIGPTKYSEVVQAAKALRR
jgi:hypothetical protein